MIPEQRVKRVIEVFHSYSDEEQRNREYWWSRSPEERLQHIEELRRINYGNAITDSRLQRVLEVARRP
ncbi:MAG: hypothetical protein EB084_16935 [Proteobacteria bacterium]|nr:hypothetical protein [Pseudomonadota bacterium]